MKKSLLALAAMACLGMFNVGCGGAETPEEACDQFDAKVCSDTEICRARTTLFGYEGSCALSDEACDEFYPEGWNWDDDLWTCVSSASSEGGNVDPTDPYCHEQSDCESTALGCNIDESLGLNSEGKPQGYCDPVDGENPPYKYVRIDDLSPNQTKIITKEDPGADIDAVVLTKKDGGTLYYAAAVKGYSRGDGKSSKDDEADATHAYNPNAALDAPDSVTSYPNVDGSCQYLNSDKSKYTFVSLGGLGGWMILEMQDKIEDGDKLDVLEVGDCKLNNMRTDKDGSVKAGAEEIQVQVSVSEAYNGSWKVVAKDKASKGVITATISGLTSSAE